MSEPLREIKSEIHLHIASPQPLTIGPKNELGMDDLKIFFL